MQLARGDASQQHLAQGTDATRNGRAGAWLVPQGHETPPRSEGHSKPSRSHAEALEKRQRPIGRTGAAMRGSVGGRPSGPFRNRFAAPRAAPGSNPVHTRQLSEPNDATADPNGDKRSALGAFPTVTARRPKASVPGPGASRRRTQTLVEAGSSSQRRARDRRRRDAHGTNIHGPSPKSDPSPRGPARPRARPRRSEAHRQQPAVNHGPEGPEERSQVRLPAPQTAGDAAEPAAAHARASEESDPRSAGPGRGGSARSPVARDWLLAACPPPPAHHLHVIGRFLA